MTNIEKMIEEEVNERVNIKVKEILKKQNANKKYASYKDYIIFLKNLQNDINTLFNNRINELEDKASGYFNETLKNEEKNKNNKCDFPNCDNFKDGTTSDEFCNKCNNNKVNKPPKCKYKDCKNFNGSDDLCTNCDKKYLADEVDEKEEKNDNYSYSIDKIINEMKNKDKWLINEMKKNKSINEKQRNIKNDEKDWDSATDAEDAYREMYENDDFTEDDVKYYGNLFADVFGKIFDACYNTNKQ